MQKDKFFYREFSTNTNIFRYLMIHYYNQYRKKNNKQFTYMDMNLIYKINRLNFQVGRPLNQMYRRKETSPHRNERETWIKQSEG